MPSSEMRVVSDSRDRTIMVDPRITYRPNTVKGRRYYVIPEPPQPQERPTL